MRIVPVALTFRDATDEQLYEAVRMSIISSHVHPKSIDGAFVLTKTIILALRCESIDAFDPCQYFSILQSTARTNAMQDQINKLITIYTNQYGTSGANAQKKKYVPVFF